MKVIDLRHGRFAEIDHLNPNFRKEYGRLRITVDMLSPREHYLDQFPFLMFSIIDLFPNLKNHSCSHGQADHTVREYDMSHLISPIKIIGDVIDTVHLLEHVILELQCQIGVMHVCSGLTCNYWEPENRYDVFIETAEPELAKFACNFALELFNNLLYEREGHINLQDVVKAAQILYSNHSRPAHEVARDYEWPNSQFSELLQKLQELNFPFQHVQPAA